MKSALHTDHAHLYDVFYQNKDYQGEVEFLLDRLEDADCPTAGKALVVGCGTGRHASHLSDSGFEVTGVDKHSEMIEIADQRSDGTFEVDSIPDLDIDGEYDLVWLPFGVLNYVDKDELRPSVEALEARLSDRGMLVLDTADLIEEGHSVHMNVIEEEDAEYARVVQMRPVGETKSRWESLVFARDDESEFFINTWTLTRFTDEEVREVLEAVDLELTVREDYGPATRPHENISVFVATSST